MYFKSNVQIVFVYTKNSYFILLLGAPALKGLRHMARCFILSVGINHRARCLSHFRAGAPNRGVGVYLKSNVKLVFVYTKKSYFILLLGAPALKLLTHLARCFILTFGIKFQSPMP